MTQVIRKYGWIKQKRDDRDFRYSIERPGEEIELPKQFSLFDSPLEPPIYDQGPLGSCTGNGTSEAVCYALHKQKIMNISPSRLFIYYNARRLEGTVNEDAGASIRDAIKTINIWGACDESIWPYDVDKFNWLPPVQAYNAASKTKSVLYRAVNQNLYDLKKCIYDGWPIVFGFVVYPNFESTETAKTGILTMPSFSQDSLGGHCTVKGGWDDDKVIEGHKGAFKIRNSWGKNWGLNGYFWMPYDYALDPRLASDFWQIESLT